MPVLRSSTVCAAGREGFAFEDERVVEREQVVGVDLGFFALLAVDPDFDREVRLVFAAGFDVVGERFDDEGRVARAVPVGGVLAIVDQVLHEPRGDRALRFDGGEQLQVVGVGFELAAVPVPPDVLRQVQVGGLVLVVLDDVLADVLHDHRELLGFVLLVAGRGRTSLSRRRRAWCDRCRGDRASCRS